MLTKTKNGIQRKLDDKECWDTYMSWGAAASHKKLRLFMQEKNQVNVSVMAPFFAMWRYAIRNPEETFTQYKKWFFETASQEGLDGNITFDDFLQDLKQHGKMEALLSRSRYIEFCEKYNLSVV